MRFNLLHTVLFSTLLIFTGCGGGGGGSADTVDKEIIVNQAPTADAGAGKTVTVNDTISITGSGSDSDGTISGYQWTKGSTVLANTDTFNYTPTVVGTDTLTLTVTDNDGATDSDTMDVTVTETPNQAPTANAGIDRTVEVNQAITIAGSGSDTDGTVVGYEWKKGTAVLSTSATFTYTPTNMGTDTLTLTVTDNNGATGSDTMDVTVTETPNKAPTADAGIDRTTQVNQTISITGSGSDSDGTISSYQWKEGNTVLSNSASFDYTPITTGIHILILTVTDDDGVTDSDIMNVNVTVATPNLAPTANAGTNRTVEQNQAITITGSGSDSDGTIQSYQWKEGSTILANSASFNYSSSTLGVHTLTLTVTDNDGATGNDTMSVNVTVPNNTPSANAGIDRTVELSQTISISGSGTDSDGTILSYQWKEGSTVLANYASFNYTPTTTGIHTLTLTVTDNNGATDSDIMNVDVPNIVPIADAGIDRTTQANQTISITGSGSDSGGSIVSYQWTKGGMTLANTAIFDYTPTVIGTDTLILTVTDNEGATDSDTMDVTVTETPNQTPTADAGANRTVQVNQSIVIEGSGNDTDGTINNYEWKEGSTVLANGPTASSFTYNGPATPGVHTLTLTVTDNDGATDSDTMDVSVTNGFISISGKVTYDLVPVDSDNVGLDYDNIRQETVKGAQVDAIDSSNQSIDSTTTDISGNYVFDSLPINTQVKIRVSAKLFKTGTPNWDVKVVDNTNSSALYVMEGSLSTTGTINSIRHLNASSGWDVNSYTSSRVAAPFAVLDNVYSSIQKVLSANSSTSFPPLLVNWSVKNVSTSGNTNLGQITTSHYTNGNLFILGDADTDTDEYDDHIITHEWGHYYEDKFSRSDSIGGAHGGNDHLDIRVAFGEGWGNAFSGMALDNPVYFDTLGSAQSSGFNFNVESGTSSTKGWYSESSIQRILYDLYDNSNDGSDTLNLGFAPIHKVFTGAEKTTPAFTSIFTFITALKDENSGDVSKIDTIVSSENIATILDIFGTGRSNLNDEYPYSNLTIGTPIQVCLSNAHGTYNKLSNRKYVKFNVNTSASHTISVIRTSGTSNTDPDIRIYQTLPSFSYRETLETGVTDSETGSFDLGSGKSYLLDIYDYNEIADTCYTVNITIN